jgi:hypothetical protein
VPYRVLATAALPLKKTLRRYRVCHIAAGANNYAHPASLLSMRALPRKLTLTVLGLLLFSGCRNGGSLGGNSSATGDSADQSQKQQTPQNKQKGGQAQPPDTEPQNTVSGQPSAASDRGGADAVAHRSVAQPGAPQGTAPDSSQKPAPKPQSPQH